MVIHYPLSVDFLTGNLFVIARSPDSHRGDVAIYSFSSCHCEEWDDEAILKMCVVRLLRFARNDMESSESHRAPVR
jgi:hypothetical protein